MIRHAILYDVSPTQISRWKASGVRTGVPCPLDRPDQMPEWWQKMMTLGEYSKGVPLKILHAAARAGVAIDKVDDPDPIPATDQAPSEASQPIDYAASLELAEKNVGVMREMFNRAQASGDDRLTIALQRPLNDALDSHRALMRDRGKIQAEAGETLPKSEVRAALLEIHGNITKRFRQRLKSSFADVPDHAESQQTWGIFVDGLVDGICQGMQETDFAAQAEK